MVVIKMRLLIFLVLSRYGLGCKYKIIFQTSIYNWIQNCIFRYLWYFVFLWSDYNLIWQPSRQILVLGTSRGCPSPKFPGRLTKILLTIPGISRTDVPIWHSGDVSKWSPDDVLIWRPRQVPGRLIQDSPWTFSGRPLDNP